MILDLPPHIEQAIIARAESQGLSVIEMLAKDYSDIDIWLELDKHGLYSDNIDLKLTDDQAQQLLDILENPPQKTPLMRELLELGERMMNKDSHV